MDPTRLGKSIKCILRCTDDVINAFTSGAGAEVSRSVDAYKKHFAELNDGFVSPPSPESGRRASFAKAWLEAFLTVKVFNKLQPMLGVVSERASLIATSGSISAARCVRRCNHDLQGRIISQQALSKATWVGHSGEFGQSPHATDTDSSRLFGLKRRS